MCIDSASLGAALRAAHGWVCQEKQSFVPMALILDLAVKVNNAFECSLKAETGSADLHHHYGRLASVRAEIEQQLLHNN
jgi:xylulokinase